MEETEKKIKKEEGIGAMNVVYVCDEKFAWIAGISILSLLQHNRDVEIFLLGWKLTDESKKKLMYVACNEGGKLNIIEIPSDYINMEFETSRWPAIATVRMHMDKFLPERVTKALYLDSDTVVLDDLTSLWNQDMCGNFYCGVKDCINWRYRRNIGLPKDSLYINSGVMLADVEKLRTVDITSRSCTWMNRYFSAVSYPDQDLLNGLFQGKLGVIEPRYNVMTIIANWNYKELCLLRRPTGYYTEEELQRARQNPAIVHYTTNLWTIRPWYFNSDHPWVKEFDRYVALSPWKNKKKEKVTRKALSVKILKVIQIMPVQLSLMMIGCIHTFVYPVSLMLKNKIYRKVGKVRQK